MITTAISNADRWQIPVLALASTTEGCDLLKQLGFEHVTPTNKTSKDIEPTTPSYKWYLRPSHNDATKRSRM